MEGEQQWILFFKKLLLRHISGEKTLKYHLESLPAIV